LNRAVFLDRDGTIIVDANYVVRTDQVRVYAGAGAAVRSLRKAGFKIIVISNQSAVGRGMIDQKQLGVIDRDFKRKLGAKIDAVYYCVHAPDRKCRCRKPGTLLLEKARRRFRLELSSCYMVGDTTRDLLCAKRAGVTAILVRTGKGGRDGLYPGRPDAVCRNLAAAARRILKGLK
jgi:D-glycero-D-manno-heptose 1,7-bisphosphate phosphatase